MDNSTIKQTWKSPSNIALIKYWGKYGNQLPCNPSISITLKKAYTETTIELSEKKSNKLIELSYYFEGKQNEAFGSRIEKFLEKNIEFVPEIKNYHITVYSNNTFPHSTGIASSASAFSALAISLISSINEATGSVVSKLDMNQVSELSRLGSGSACRSVFPNYALWGKTDALDTSSNNYAVEVIDIHPDFLTIKDSILIADDREKAVSSSIGHGLMNNHPYAEERFKQAKERIPVLLKALKEGDWATFIEITESEALTLHAMMMCSKEYYLLFHPNTIEIINRIFEFRKETGLNLCFTLDAGPNVHLLYPANIEDKVLDFIENTLKPFTKNIIHDEIGEGAVRLK